MVVFSRLRYTLARFMAGRYGVDALGKALVVFYLILWGVSLFLRGIAFLVFDLLTQAVLIYGLFRMLSRNIPARQRENERFLRIRGKCLADGRLRLLWDRVRYLGKWSFRRCPACSAVLRLPVKRGKRTVTCSRCHTQFRTFIL